MNQHIITSANGYVSTDETLTPTSKIPELIGTFEGQIEEIYEKHKALLRNIHLWPQAGLTQLAAALTQFLDGTRDHLMDIERMLGQTAKQVEPGKSTEMSIWINEEAKAMEDMEGPKENTLVISTSDIGQREPRLIWDTLAIC